MVECKLPKLDVVGSTPIARFMSRPYSLAGRVVRIDPQLDLVSLKFANASESVRSRILFWIFREQVRRHQRVLANDRARRSHAQLT